MGASFQAPHATPGQRPMEMHHGEHLKQSLFFIHSKIIQHVCKYVGWSLDWQLGFLTISNSNGFRFQQFSHFIGIPIDASQLFITEHPVGEAGYSVTSFLQCLAQGQGKRKNKNQFLVSKVHIMLCPDQK